MSADFSRAPSLGGAFLGYEYQDVVAAGLLAVGLVEGLDFLATEIPRGSDTAFDDIEIRQGARTTRFQVKHSKDADRRLRAADLGRKGTLSLAGMAAAAAEEPATAKSYRVLLTWSEPDEDELAGRLVAAPDVQPALPGWATRRYRLDAEMIWPSGATPAPFSGLDVARADRAALVALCERAVFEFAAPAMSKDLDAPGPSANDGSSAISQTTLVSAGFRIRFHPRSPPTASCAWRRLPGRELRLWIWRAFASALSCAQHSAGSSS